MSEHTCIVLRVRRVVHEDAYVAVPIDDVMKTEPEADGTLRIDFAKFVAEAARLSKEPSVDSAEEERTTTAHPTQGPVPAGRRVYDVHTVKSA